MRQSFMHKSLKLTNIFGEKLDILISWKCREPKAINIYVHGFGTDKDEGFASFLDMSNFLDNEFINIRCDLSGYGKSEGKDYKFSIFKASADINTLLLYAFNNYDLPVNIIAHSMGTFVTLLTMPIGVNKIILSSIVNADTKFITNWLKQRILNKGGVIDENGISVYLRSSGAVQLIGRDFWHILKNFDPVPYIKAITKFTPIYVFKPKEDDVLPNKSFSVYKELNCELENFHYIEINGNHNFTNKKHRLNLFKLIRTVLIKN